LVIYEWVRLRPSHPAKLPTEEVFKGRGEESVRIALILMYKEASI